MYLLIFWFICGILSLCLMFGLREDLPEGVGAIDLSEMILMFVLGPIVLAFAVITFVLNFDFKTAYQELLHTEVRNVPAFIKNKLFGYRNNWTE